MTKRIFTILIFLIISSCSGIDLSNDNSALSYLLSYEFSRSHPLNYKKDKDKLKSVIDKFPETDGKYSEDPLCRSYYDHLNLLKDNNLIVDPKAYWKGIEDFHKGNKFRISSERTEMLKQLFFKTLSSGENITPGNFKKKLASWKDVRKTGSGLFYKKIRTGKGTRPNESNRVTAHMVGKLPNGIEITNTYLKGSPMSFYLKMTIPGIKEGLKMMPLGSKYIFYVPPKLGYKNKSRGMIPANSFLIYEIELLEIK